MAISSVTVTLTAAERLELERIVLDGDERAALEFLREAVHAQIERAERGR